LWAAAAALLCLTATAADAADAAQADKLFETAMSAYKLERYEDAGKKFYDFMSAAPRDPRNDQAQYYAARSFMHRNYLQRALEEFGYLIEDFPDSAFATLGLHDRAQCHLKTRSRDKAIADLERTIARPVEIYEHGKDPMKRLLYENHRQDVFWLAKQYLESKQHDKAIAAYGRLPKPLEAFRYVVDVHYSLRRYERIKELIDGLRAENRHHGFKHLIEFYGRKKALNQLKSIFEKLQQEPNPTRATDDLIWTTADSFVHSGREQWDWAMRHISQHYARLARRADYELARHHWQEPAYLDELELFVIKFRTGGDVDNVLRWKGIVLERLDRGEEARKTYRRMGDAGLGHWYAAETFHGGYARKKDFAAAAAEYAELRKAFYSMEWAAMAQWRVVAMHQTLKDVDKTVEALRHIAERFSTLTIAEGRYSKLQKRFLGVAKRRHGPAAQLAAGDALRAAKRFDDAEMEYRIAVRKYPKTGEAAAAAYRVALCCEGREDPETAIKVLKSVLRRYPKTPAASDAHTRLETRYNIADTDVSDEIDVFAEIDEEQQKKKKNYLEDPTKLEKKKQ